MKIRHKIFVSILFASLFVYNIAAILLLRSIHSDSLRAEKNHAENEFQLIETSLKNAFDGMTGVDKQVTDMVERYSNYYKSRNIALSFYHENGKQFYNGTPLLSKNVYKQLQETDSEKYFIKIHKTKGQEYLIIATGFEEGSLYYVRNVHELYINRQHRIMLALSAEGILIIMLAVLSFWLSRRITRPMEQILNGTRQIEESHYEFEIPVSKDEMGELAKGFNKMAGTVQLREQQMEQSLRQRQDFIDAMAHEMNTPLTAIQGYAEMLQKGNLTDEMRMISLKNIQRETKRIQAMHKKLKLLSLLREEEMTFEPVLLQNVFSLANEELSRFAAQKKISIQVPQDHILVRGDSFLLEMLISNLLRNAISYSDEGKKIVGQIQQDNEKKVARVYIQDQGIGIPPDKIERLFEPFFRVDKSRSRKSGGSGLGLSVCKKIVDLHGGTIRIQSKPEEGTLVIIELPLKE